MNRLTQVISLSAYIGISIGFSACASAGPSKAVARYVASQPKYAAYTTPSGKHVIPARPVAAERPVMYPPLAAFENVKGTIKVCFKVSRHGKVESPHIVSENIFGGEGSHRKRAIAELDQSAIEAARGMEYSPKTIDGKPVPGKDCQDISFNLKR